MKKLVLLLFAIVAGVGMMKAATMAVETGVCGESLTYRLDSKANTLLIEGSGEMTSAPWLDNSMYVKYVSLPAGLTRILEGAFTGCPVESLTALSVTPPAGGAKSGITPANCQLYVSEGSEEFYSGAIWWEDFKSIEESTPVISVYYNLALYVSGNGSVSGDGDYLEGTKVKIEATPSTGYHFSSWSDGNTNAVRTVEMTQDTAFTAYFDINRYVVSVTCDENQGWISGSSGTYNYGSIVNFYAYPNSGYLFTQWSDGSTQNHRQITVDQDITLKAEFGVAYILNVNKSSGSGKVSGSGTYFPNTQVQIEANPSTGYYFSQWSDGNTENPRIITLTQDTTISAEFSPYRYTFSVASSDETKGTVDGKSGEYDYGTYVTVTALPKNGYILSQWSDGSTELYREIYITKDISLTAEFVPGFTVQALAGEGGEVSGGGGYTPNSTVTLYPNPSCCYTFDQWSDGNKDNPRTFVLTQDTSFTAQFVKGNVCPITDSGTCGADLSWELTCDGVLTIRGKGDMENWKSDKYTPWQGMSIKHVIIEEGVTSVGDYAFRNCSTIVSISLPNSLLSIEQHAFRRANITSVTIPANVTSIGSSAFYDCEKLSTVTCYRSTPPYASGRVFPSKYSQLITINVPCGSSSAYLADTYWKSSYWTYNEGAYDYSLDVYTVVLKEPTCTNHGTLIVQAAERDGYFFSQWNDGNKDNPRTIQLETGTHYSFAPEYIEGVIMNVCKGYEFQNPQNGKTYTINSNRVIGKYHFYLKTANKPALAAEEYPLMQVGRMYYGNAEKALRARYAALNPNAAEITSVEWAYSVSNEKTADTYIKSEILPPDEYASAWVKYSLKTECGDVIADTLLIYKTSAAESSVSSLPSTEGRDFWVGLILVLDPDNRNVDPEPFIAVSTKEPTTIHITNPNSPEWEGVTRGAGANEWVVFTKKEIPIQYWYPENISSFSAVENQAGQIHNFGIHVETDKDVSVFAAQRREYSYDAAFILPAGMLQNEYITQDYPPYNNNGNSYTEVVIVATENNTNVEITPKTTTVDGHAAGVPYSVSLQKGQTYYVISQTDVALSGTNVKADKPVAVFQGNTFTQVPGGWAARDCLYEQAMPMEYWGTKFVVTRSMQKDANRVRVTAMEDGTTLRIDGQQLATIDAGETYEFELSIGDMNRAHERLIRTLPDVIQQNAVYLESSCPVAVYSYDVSNKYEAEPTEMVQSSGSKNAGDPAMVWISPIEQRINDITFGACGTDKTTRHFINIVCRTEDTHLTNLSSGMRLSIPLEFIPVPGNKAYSYARVFLADDKNVLGEKVFRLTNPHGVIAHIYGHGYDESYSYSVGSAAVKRGVGIDGETQTSGTTVEKQFCLGDPIQFNAQVGTDVVDRIDWNFGDGKKIKNGDIAVEHLYEKAGVYDVKANVYTHKECPFTLYEPEEMTFRVKVGLPDTLRREYAICEGESFIHNGQLYTGAGKDTIVYGCDSVEVFELKLANCQTETPDTIVVDPTNTTAEFVWPILPNAFSYTLTIWADQAQTVPLCTLTFNAAGYLINIEFGSALYAANSPMRVPEKKKQKEQIIVVGTTTLNFTITGLESNHTYYYLMQAYDEYGNVIDSKTGHFTTDGVAASIDQINEKMEKCENAKILHNGHLLILRGDKVYTVTGQEVR